jgi:predicted enzyme related to lactoylglutathione lyase
MGKDANVKQLWQIGQIALTVQNLERATQFYRDNLEVPFLFQTGNLSFFDCNGLRLMLALPEEQAEAVQERQGNSIIYFKVDDLRQSYQRLLEKGVKFEDAPHLIARLETTEVWMAFFRDSESNLLGLMSEIALDQTK